MQYPSKLEYDNAIWNLDKTLRCVEFAGGIPRNNGLDLTSYSGGSSRVYLIDLPENRTVVLRVWLREISDAQSRYLMADQYFQDNPNKYFTNFRFIEKGLEVNKQIWPIVYMDWVEGQTLNRFVDKNLFTSPRIVSALAEQFLEMANSLHLEQISHGDLQDGNILITEGPNESGIKLIDYDTLFISGFDQLERQALGIPNYQHPRLNRKSAKNYKWDYFSELVIYLSLTAYVENPNLWIHQQEKTLLFNKNDFLDPQKSKIFEMLTSYSADIRYLSKYLAKYCYATDYNQLLPLENILLNQYTKNSLYFPNGRFSKSIDELVRICEADPDMAVSYLLGGQIEEWLTHSGQITFANYSKDARLLLVPDSIKLKYFLDKINIPHHYLPAEINFDKNYIKLTIVDPGNPIDEFPEESIIIKNTGGSNLSVNIRPLVEWITVVPDNISLSPENSIKIKILTSYGINGYPPRPKDQNSVTVNGNIEIETNVGSKSIEVELILQFPILAVVETKIDFGEVEKNNDDEIISQQSINISNSGFGVLSGKIKSPDWIKLSADEFFINSGKSQELEIFLLKNCPQPIIAHGSGLKSEFLSIISNGGEAELSYYYKFIDPDSSELPPANQNHSSLLSELFVLLFRIVITPCICYILICMLINSRLIDVSSTLDWQDTSIQVGQGDFVTIFPISGKWSAGFDNPNFPMVSAVGYQEGLLGSTKIWSYSKWCLDKSTFSANWPLGVLRARVSNSNNYFQLGLPASNLFHIVENGNLFLGMNDCSFYDNKGVIKVWVTKYPNIITPIRDIFFGIKDAVLGKKMYITSTSAWQDTGFRVNQGDTIVVQVKSGLWSADSNNLEFPMVDANGYQNSWGGLNPGWKYSTWCSERIDQSASWPLGILLAKVSNSTNYFQVGMSKTFQVTDSGNLLLGMNDCTFFDNTGEVEIWITRYPNLVPQMVGIIPSIFATQIPTHTPSFTPTRTSIMISPSTPTFIPSQTSIVQPTPTLGIGSPQVSEIDGMVMRYVPAGPFKMGSNNGELVEKPANTIEIDSYWIDQTEVTIKMYALCVHSGVCSSPDNNSANPNIVNYYGNPKYDNYPVIQISWSQAKTYCEWTGRRLPTEKEWEKAARGRDARTYPWGNEVNGLYANYGQSNGNETGTMKVGSFKSIETPYEVYDMAGNVWEWVADWYDVYPGGDVNASSYFGESYRVVRGGAWNSFIQQVRSFSRDGRDPSIAFFDVGFRCARSK